MKNWLPFLLLVACGTTGCFSLPTSKDTKAVPRILAAIFGYKKDDADFISEVISAHNKFRKIHGSPELSQCGRLRQQANMYAQTLAETGTREPQKDPKIPFRLGENVYVSCGNDVAGDDVVNKWYDEVCSYFGNGGKKAYEHFAQIVWRSTQLIGVGRAESNNADQKCTYVVVRYNPGSQPGSSEFLNVPLGSFNTESCSRSSVPGGTATKEGNAQPAESVPCETVKPQPAGSVPDNPQPARGVLGNGVSPQPVESVPSGQAVEGRYGKQAPGTGEGTSAAGGPEAAGGDGNREGGSKPESRISSLLAGVSSGNNGSPGEGGGQGGTYKPAKECPPCPDAFGGTSSAGEKPVSQEKPSSESANKGTSEIQGNAQGKPQLGMTPASQVPPPGQVGPSDKEGKRPSEKGPEVLPAPGNTGAASPSEGKAVSEGRPNIGTNGQEPEQGKPAGLVRPGNNGVPPSSEGEAEKEISPSGEGKRPEEGTGQSTGQSSIPEGQQGKGESIVTPRPGANGAPSTSETNPSGATGGLSSSNGQNPGASGTKPEGTSAEHPFVESLEEFQKSALEAHNKYRGFHNAPPLIPDNEMATKATEYAKKLSESGIDNAEHSLMSSRNNEGESVYTACGLNPTGAEVTKEWYRELCNYDYQKHDRVTSTKPTGHFTQVVWKSTKEFGIGKAYATENNKECVFIVARYKPAGNIVGSEAANIERGTMDAEYCGGDFASRGDGDANDGSFEKVGGEVSEGRPVGSSGHQVDTAKEVATEGAGEETNRGKADEGHGLNQDRYPYLPNSNTPFKNRKRFNGLRTETL